MHVQAGRERLKTLLGPHQDARRGPTVALNEDIQAVPEILIAEGGDLRVWLGREDAQGFEQVGWRKFLPEALDVQ